MKWLRTGRQLGQAVKNVQRLQQILSVFSKHGFADVVMRMNLGKFLPRRLSDFATSQSEKNTPQHIREAFEELGPTFVKLGQLLSTRPDLLPDSYIEEFTRLQDSVQPIEFESVKKVIESELGQPIDKIFAYFDPKPLASASISQVHTARLNSGEIVVVKVQRPEIKKLIDRDISLLAFLANMLEKYIPESRIANPSIVVNEFFRTISFELDFVVEANNITKITENMTSIPEIVIPKLFKEYCSSKVLTMEKFEGIRVNDIEALDRAGIDRKHIMEIGARAFFKSIMMDGLFHGDLHGGNMFVLPGNKLGIIDFGIVGRLSQRARDQLAQMVFALMSEDFESLCYTYAELGAVKASIDFDSFQRDIRNSIAPYIGLAIGDVNIGKVLIESTKVATKYQISIPGDWMIVFKAILTTEGMGRKLDPDFDMLKHGQGMIKELIKEQYSPQRLGRDFMVVARDMAALLQVLPRQIRWMFKKFNSNDFAFEIKSPDLDRIRRQIHQHGVRQSLSVVAAGLFIASSLALPFQGGRMWGGYPAISVIYFAIAVLFLFRLAVIRKK